MKNSAAVIKPDPGRIGIALGGGGARGLAHVLMLEVLDELGIKPYRIAGTSIGAILGALYCSGHTALDIKKLIETLLRTEKKRFAHALIQMNIAKWIDIIDPKLGKGGLVNADHFLGLLHNAISQAAFEELPIPLQVVSTDYWTGEQVVFDSGELWPAIRASMALPGVFAPVEHDGRLLVDGGIVNPLPFDLIMETCTFTIAVDVTGTMLKRVHEKPAFFESIFRTVRIMGQAITSEKLKWQQPDILVRPLLTEIRTLDFKKFEEVYRQATPAKEELRKKLGHILS